MNNDSYRGVPTAAVLAVVGAVLAVALLGVSWYSVSPEGVQWVAANAPLDATPEQYAATHPLDWTMNLIVSGLQDRQQGWDLETSMWKAFRIGAAILAVFAAVMFTRTRESGPLQRIAFLVAAVVFAAAPAIRLTTTLGPKQSAMLDVAPAMYGSFVAAALMLAALVLTSRHQAVAEIAGPAAPMAPSAGASSAPPSYRGPAGPGLASR